ncbi:MAG: Na+/H+ antiporter NhaC family protein [Balneolaceae bacterium]
MKFSFPHPLAILLIFIALAAILTHIIPSGQYDRTIDAKTGREVVVSNSYQQVEAEPIGVFDAVVKVPEGIIFGADIVVLILIIGGAFVVVDKTGAFNDGITALIKRFQHAQGRVMVLVGLVFATAGALNHTFEEIIPMIPFLVIMANKLGYTKISAIAISAGSASIGAAFSPINPFGVLIAQKISEVAPFSGTWFRLIVLLIVLSFWIWWVLRIGKDKEAVQPAEPDDQSKLPRRSALILTLVLLTFATMVYGILAWDWGYNQMSALFLVMGIVAGLIGQLGINGTSKAYAAGFQEMAFAAIIVGLARSIYLILEEGIIIDSIVYGLFNPLQDLPTAIAAFGMTLSHALIHIPIPSASGHAVLTMPLLTPLADLIGMSRQVMILCYQYGGIIMDMITPTNGALLAILTAAGISYKDWIVYCWKPFLVIMAISLTAIMVSIVIGL